MVLDLSEVARQHHAAFESERMLSDVLPKRGIYASAAQGRLTETAFAALMAQVLGPQASRRNASAHVTGGHLMERRFSQVAPGYSLSQRKKAFGELLLARRVDRNSVSHLVRMVHTRAKELGARHADKLALAKSPQERQTVFETVAQAAGQDFASRFSRYADALERVRLGRGPPRFHIP